MDPPRPAKRLKAALAPNLFAQFTALANQHQAANLGQGFPSFGSPSFLKQAVVDAIETDVFAETGAPKGLGNQYTRPGGEPGLVQTIARAYSSRFGRDLDPMKEVVTTIGAQEAIFTSLFAWTDPGDEVVVFTPCFDAVMKAASIVGAKLVGVNMRPSASGDLGSTSSWSVSLAELEKLKPKRAANKKRVWWELQEDVIDEVQQRFGLTPPKLQWEQGSEVQLAALRAWNRDVTEQRWPQPLARQDRSPRRGDWYSSEEKDIYDLPTVSLSVKNSDTDPGGRSPRRGRRVEQSGAFGNPQNSSPDDQSILAWQIEECAIKDLANRQADRAGAKELGLSDGPHRPDRRVDTAEGAALRRSTGICRPNPLTSTAAYGERSSSSTPNYGNAEVYHLADYSDGDTTYSAGLTSGPCYESHSKVRDAASGAGNSCSIFGKQSRRESHGIPDPPPRTPLADRKTLNIVLDWHGVLDVNIRSGGRTSQLLHLLRVPPFNVPTMLPMSRFRPLNMHSNSNCWLSRQQAIGAAEQEEATRQQAEVLRLQAQTVVSEAHEEVQVPQATVLCPPKAQPLARRAVVRMREVR
ncbi:unnamed protein product [Effrenium voratum]|uniref:Aminotransferase class I/classII large domain-containing protein n=1 Tax=Effrenium voratum TaxID=2562239 RepID=A0AA36MK20_9DINO|nr:unnamed protein product [Effrenium voratum]